MALRMHAATSTDKPRAAKWSALEPAGSGIATTAVLRGARSAPASSRARAACGAPWYAAIMSGVMPPVAGTSGHLRSASQRHCRSALAIESSPHHTSPPQRWPAPRIKRATAGRCHRPIKSMSESTSPRLAACFRASQRAPAYAPIAGESVRRVPQWDAPRWRVDKHVGLEQARHGGGGVALAREVEDRHAGHGVCVRRVCALLHHPLDRVKVPAPASAAVTGLHLCWLR